MSSSGDLKKAVRLRMAQTGEKYTTSLRAPGERPGRTEADERPGQAVAASREGRTGEHVTREREYQLFPVGSTSGWRSWIIRHLHEHPDHAGNYPRGHDFVLLGTVDIAREHEHWHDNRSTFATHEHERPWRVMVKEDSEMAGNRKMLDLKVTVAASPGEDPDSVLDGILKRSPKDRVNLMQLRYGMQVLEVTKIERADGQEFGLEAAFEEYWRGLSKETATVKEESRNAFMDGARWRKENG
jgi:hypothetical protein